MAIENLSSYTKVDTGEKLTVTAPKADANGVTSFTDCYLYKDFGVDHFDALNIDFEIYCEDQDTYPLGFGGIGLSGTIGSPPNWAATDLHSLMFDYTTTNVAYVRLMKGDDSGEDNYITSVATLYYCTLSRPAGNDTITLKIYSDSNRANLVDTLTLAGFNGIKWRYFYAFTGQRSEAERYFDGYVQNINLHEAAPAGRFYGFITG